MKNKIYLLLVVIAVVLGSISWTVSAQKTNSAKQTWEYKTITVFGVDSLPPTSAEQLNRLGSEGWELVTILYQESNSNPSQRHRAEYYFKRAK